MTAWQSMFDAGACIVECRQGVAINYSGVLGKSQSSPPFTIQNGWDAQIDVDAAGVVTLNGNTMGDFSGVELNVYPQYDTRALGTRMIAISSIGLASIAWAYDDALYTIFNEAPLIQLATNADDSFGLDSPSIVEFSPHSPVGGTFGMVGMRPNTGA